jgi:hypothetical protein
LVIVKNDWHVIIGGERPLLPDYIKIDTQDLQGRCWHIDPLKRPRFEDIMQDVSKMAQKLYKDGRLI